VLKLAEGDWASTWFFRRRTKSHNRTLKDRKKKRKDPRAWAEREAKRKLTRFNKLSEELERGDLDTVERALYQKAVRDNQGDRFEEDNDFDRGNVESTPSSDEEPEEDDYRRFYHVEDRLYDRSATTNAHPRDLPAHAQRQRAYESDDELYAPAPPTPGRRPVLHNASYADDNDRGDPLPAKRVKRPAARERSYDSDDELYAPGPAQRVQRPITHEASHDKGDRDGPVPARRVQRPPEREPSYDSDDELYAPAPANRVQRPNPRERSFDDDDERDNPAAARHERPRAPHHRSSDRDEDHYLPVPAKRVKQPAGHRSSYDAKDSSRDATAPARAKQGKQPTPRQASYDDDDYRDIRAPAREPKRSMEYREEPGDNVKKEPYTPVGVQKAQYQSNRNVSHRNGRTARRSTGSLPQDTAVVNKTPTMKAPMMESQQTDDNMPDDMPITMITDGNGFDDFGLDQAGYNKFGFDAAGNNRSGQNILNFPLDYLASLQDEIDYHEANNMPWTAPPMLDEDIIRDMYPEWYAAHDARFQDISQVKNGHCVHSARVCR
jgi:hypothetical protein